MLTGEAMMTVTLTESLTHCQAAEDKPISQSLMSPRLSTPVIVGLPCLNLPLNSLALAFQYSCYQYQHSVLLAVIQRNNNVTRSI